MVWYVAEISSGDLLVECVALDITGDGVVEHFVVDLYWGRC